MLCAVSNVVVVSLLEAVLLELAVDCVVLKTVSVPLLVSVLLLSPVVVSVLNVVVVLLLDAVVLLVVVPCVVSNVVVVLLLVSVPLLVPVVVLVLNVVKVDLLVPVLLELAFEVWNAVSYAVD